MMKHFFSLLIFFTFVLTNMSASQKIYTENLTENDREWFIESFVSSFMSVYKDKVFVMTLDDQQAILGPNENKQKELAVCNASINDFDSYITEKKDGYYAVKVLQDKQKVGALLYRLMDHKVLYIGQYFILPEYQKKGIGTYVVQNLLPKLHPEYTRYEVLTRHQNDAGVYLYRNLDFLAGNQEIVEKYGYDPLQFMSLYKNLKHAQNKSEWYEETTSDSINQNVLYLPIGHANLTNIEIQESGEELIDLSVLNHSRIQPLKAFNSKYQSTSPGYSKVRIGLYERLMQLLDQLPEDIGIAYFEGFRSLGTQQKYFDKKFNEVLLTISDKDIAYKETCKCVSPYLNNTPVHCTGAAIDMTLYRTVNGESCLLDMGQFGTIFCPNIQEQTFSEHTTKEQKLNRLLLLEAATQVGLVNYGYEWWHYSYGDRAWAYLKNENFAKYGLIESIDSL